jgi:hypothetical protein
MHLSGVGERRGQGNMGRGLVLVALTALMWCPAVWGVNKAFTNPEMLAQVRSLPRGWTESAGVARLEGSSATLPSTTPLLDASVVTLYLRRWSTTRKSSTARPRSSWL